MAIVDEWARKKISKERKKQRKELRGKVSTIFKGWRRCVFVGIGTGGWEDRFSVLFLLFLSFPLPLALCNFVFFFTLLSLHEAARLRKPTPSSSLLISHSCFFFLSLASTVVLIVVLASFSSPTPRKHWGCRERKSKTEVPRRWETCLSIAC